MMIFRRFAAMPLAVFCACVGAADIYVSPAGDDANPGTEALPLATIDAAVAAASAGDTIFLKPGLYEGPEHRGHDIDFDLAFVGDGPRGSVICSGDDALLFDQFSNAIGSGRFATFDGVAASVENITFSRFRFSINSETFVGFGGGAALFSLGGQLDVADCTFVGNLDYSSTSEGGAISVRDALLTVSDSTFTRNTAERTTQSGVGFGGAIFVRSNQPCTIEDSTFDGNQASPGGGIVEYEGSSDLTLSGVRFEQNEAGGGCINVDRGIQASAPGPNLTVLDCVFDRNQGGDGFTGAITTRGVNELAIFNSIFFRNRIDGDITVCAEGRGGAITVFDRPQTGPTMTTIENSLFVGNTAAIPEIPECDFPEIEDLIRGHAIFAPRAEITNCTFAYNQRSRPSVGFDVPANPNQSALEVPDLTVRNSVFYEPNNILVPGATGATFSNTISFFDEGLAGVTVADPLFENLPAMATGLDSAVLADVNLRLTAASPAIDEGDNAVVTTTLDLDGNNRIADGDADGSEIVDMGAYEFRGAPCLADITGDSILNTADINAFVQAFLASDPVADFNNDGNFNNGDVNLFVQSFIAGCD